MMYSERESSSVIDEILYWIDCYHVKDFAFYDDALLCRTREKLISLLKGIIKALLPVAFILPMVFMCAV